MQAHPSTTPENDGMTLTRRKARRVSVIVELLGCDRATVKRMIDDGRLDGYRVGHLIYIYLDSVDEYRQSAALSTERS